MLRLVDGDGSHALPAVAEHDDGKAARGDGCVDHGVGEAVSGVSEEPGRHADVARDRRRHHLPVETPDGALTLLVGRRRVPDLRGQLPRPSWSLTVGLVPGTVDQVDSHRPDPFRARGGRDLRDRQGDRQEGGEHEANGPQNPTDQPRRPLEPALEEEDVAGGETHGYQVERDHLPSKALELDLGEQRHRDRGGDDPPARPGAEDHGPSHGEQRGEGENRFEASQDRRLRLRTATG